MKEKTRKDYTNREPVRWPPGTRMPAPIRLNTQPAAASRATRPVRTRSGGGLNRSPKAAGGERRNAPCADAFLCVDAANWRGAFARQTPRWHGQKRRESGLAIYTICVKSVDKFYAIGYFSIRTALITAILMIGMHFLDASGDGRIPATRSAGILPAEMRSGTSEQREC